MAGSPAPEAVPGSVIERSISASTNHTIVKKNKTSQRSKDPKTDHRYRMCQFTKYMYFIGSGVRWQHAEHYDVARPLIVVQISPIVLVSLIQIIK